jgi:hypothetical protein
MYAAITMEDYLHVLRMMPMAHPMPAYVQMEMEVQHSQQMLIVVSHKSEKKLDLNLIDFFSFSYRYNCYSDTSSNNNHCYPWSFIKMS